MVLIFNFKIKFSAKGKNLKCDSLKKIRHTNQTNIVNASANNCCYLTIKVGIKIENQNF